MNCCFFEKRELILFQGDSVTDCQRSREDLTDLGRGYPLFIAARLSAALAGHEFIFVNRGISGNRVRDLEARWDADCVSLKPTLVSILIGINDTWRRFDSNDPTSETAYGDKYRGILERTVKETGARLIVLEPFALPAESIAEYDKWREDLDPKIHFARKLAREFGAAYVPLDGIFAAACAKKPPEHWAPDGVHPSAAGHGVIAEAWLAAAGVY